MRWVLRMALVAGALGACVAALATSGRTVVAAPSTSTATAVVATAADAIVASNPLGHLNQDDPLGVLAYQGDALARSAQALAVSDPARAQRYLAAATAIADYLVQQDALESDGAIGWGLPRAWDAFGDGTINPPNQIYGFQTALVSLELLDTYVISQNSAYLTAVESAMASYMSSGTTSFGQGCQGCFLFWYSTNTNDAGRYVKNTNALLGQVEARLFQATGNTGYRAIASAVYNEEGYEVVQYGNDAYLGVDDPKYNPATGPDAHIALETFAYSQIAALLGLSDSQTQATFDGMVATFWHCGSACLAAPVFSSPEIATTVYSQFMACYPVAFDATLATTCERLIANPGQTNLLPFPLIGLLYALPALSPSSAAPARPQRGHPLPKGNAQRTPARPHAGQIW